jgi:hypothetical protein
VTTTAYNTTIALLVKSVTVDFGQSPDRSTWYCVELNLPGNQTLIRKEEDLGSVW